LVAVFCSVAAPVDMPGRLRRGATFVLDGWDIYILYYRLLLPASDTVVDADAFGRCDDANGRFGLATHLWFWFLLRLFPHRAVGVRFYWCWAWTVVRSSAGWFFGGSAGGLQTLRSCFVRWYAVASLPHLPASACVLLAAPFRRTGFFLPSHHPALYLLATKAWFVRSCYAVAALLFVRYDVRRCVRGTRCVCCGVALDVCQALPFAVAPSTVSTRTLVVWTSCLLPCKNGHCAVAVTTLVAY